MSLAMDILSIIAVTLAVSLFLLMLLQPKWFKDSQFMNRPIDDTLASRIIWFGGTIFLVWGLMHFLVTYFPL